MRPATAYARSGDVSIAYQVAGEGPIDLVLAAGWITHLDLAWDFPPLARFYRALAGFTRLILFDKRGTGLSDPVAADALPTLEERMDDVRAVMDAAGSERAALFGSTGGAAMCGLFAAMYPERVDRLVLFGSWRAVEPSFGLLTAFGDAEEPALDHVEREWGRGATVDLFTPSLAGDEELRDRWARLSQASVSPRSARLLMQMGYRMDWRSFLRSVRVPTLVLHRAGDRVVPAEEGRRVADELPDARFVELPGDDHLFWAGDQDAVLRELQTFLTGTAPVHEPDRILATILFTDIVDSTALAAQLGDRRWRELREAHDRAIREVLPEFRGREVETAGDSFLAIFDGPARAIRCARALQDAARPLGLRLRVGLHTGECELVEHGIRGLAVHIAARVASLAGADEVFVSSTVKDLVVGSGIEFASRGETELKGVPGEWRLFAVAG